jgi:hypothetical protein
MQVLALEGEFEKKCRAIAEKHECILLKVEKRKGWPDRLLLCPNGQMAWMEFKRVGEKPTAFQEHIHETLRRMNFRVYVVENYSQFLTALLHLKGLGLLLGSPSTIK